MATKKEKVEQVRALARAPQSLTEQETDFFKQHYHKPFMYVCTAEDLVKAQDILNRINDPETTVILIQKADWEL